MALHCRVMILEDMQEILDYEFDKLKENVPDEMERTLTSWNSRWREESLRHYLPQGWSFLVRDLETSSSDEENPNKRGKLVGLFLSQPLLFIDGMTQTLWVEHLSYSSLEARDTLCEVAYRMAREKHFQKVIFPQGPGIQNFINQYRPESWNPQGLAVKSSRI